MGFVCVTQRSLAEKKATLISTKASADEAQQLLNFWKDKLEAYNKVNLHSLWTLFRKEELSIMAELA
jgi:desulfoferrodoxin (superoxide reductase-like protein)